VPVGRGRFDRPGVVGRLTWLAIGAIVVIITAMIVGLAILIHGEEWREDE
jgi:hypothetical protein